MRKFISLSIALSFIVTPAFASDIDIAGTWWSEGKGAKVEISDCGDGTPCGILVWTDEGNPLDANNPDEALRGQPLIGAKVFWGFKRKGSKWKSGKLYDARSGKTYKSKLVLNDDGSLAVNGCVAFICDGESWTRVEE